ncbi:MAG: hypothetical protein UU37_C0001G0008 [Candidatus Gottesmanbacteria bacterium GW2011_GWA2_41_12]|uniref:DUF2079 domain-containing protein n=2 Tax=Candidatus Gottesmaniibacteriota TaxID=1752720 RepID=A0A0G0UIH4_9BACT|nr:MAG: hypothetical protein UT63_C0002G0028 [Candidatus Gottesmanbacteria bacterium GW2011_GWC2_39_8]KKR88589.1 MAG: hypothetical protein UU37_C0001G0008 [Candidatus Gottesmanbacteria bacterium GW2011_GWA2_41_12]
MLVYESMKKGFITIIFSLIFIYFLSFSLISLHRFWQYESFYYDMGIYDQSIWQVSRFQLPFTDQLGAYGKIIFADHFVPSLFLLSPFYWFTDKTEMIFIVQSLAVALSGVIAFLLARKNIKNNLVVFGLIFSYLGYVGLQNALITDFHDTTVATLVLMFIFWTIFMKKWKYYFPALIILLGFKESMAGLGLGLGLYLFLRKERFPKIAAITIFISLFWGMVTTKILIPYFSGGTYTYSPIYPKNILSWILNLFLPIIKTRTILVSLATFAFIPVFYIPLLPAILEHFLERFVLQPAATRWDLGMHYNALLSPLFFVSSLELYIILIRQKKENLVKFMSVISILMTLYIHQFLQHGPINLAFNKDFYRHTGDFKFLDNLTRAVRTDKLVMAQNNLATRFTHGKVMLLSNNYAERKPYAVVIDFRSGQNPNNFFPLSMEETNTLIVTLTHDPQYNLEKKGHDQYLFFRK